MRAGPRSYITLSKRIYCYVLPTLLAAPQAGEIVSYQDEPDKKIIVNCASLNSRRCRPRVKAVVQDIPGPKIERLVQNVSHQHQIDSELVQAVIQVESNYDTQAVSRKGAPVLMQLIPAMAHSFGVLNPLDPKQNIAGEVRLLKHFLKTYEGNIPLALAGYNAGVNAGPPRFRLTRIARYVNEKRILIFMHTGLESIRPRKARNSTPLHWGPIES